jgi:hypothetical protein
MRLTKLRVDGWINRIGILIINKNLINYESISDSKKNFIKEFDLLCHYLKNPRLFRKNDFPIIDLTETYKPNVTFLRFYNDLNTNYVQEVRMSDFYETPQSLFDISYNKEFKFQDVPLEMDDKHFYFLILRLSSVNRVFDLQEGFKIEDIKFLNTKFTINKCDTEFDSYLPFLNGMKLEPKIYNEFHNLVKLIL